MAINEYVVDKEFRRCLQKYLVLQKVKVIVKVYFYTFYKQ